MTEQQQIKRKSCSNTLYIFLSILFWCVCENDHRKLANVEIALVSEHFLSAAEQCARQQRCSFELKEGINVTPVFVERPSQDKRDKR